MNIQLVSQLIKDIYGLCLDQKSLVKVLNEFVILFQCNSVGLRIVHHDDFKIIIDVMSTCSEAELQPYAVHFSELQPYLKKNKEIERKMTEGGVYLFSDSEFYPFASDGGVMAERISEQSVFSLL